MFCGGRMTLAVLGRLLWCGLVGRVGGGAGGLVIMVKGDRLTSSLE